MAGAAVLGRLTPLVWLLAEVVELVPETPRVASLVLDVPGWAGHRPGQHVDVRLTAEDGYQAQRSYSIATPADGERLVLTVEELEDGEVSPFLTEELRPGDRFELRGPIGGYFVWDGSAGGALHLVAGGSGVVPLMAMLRHRAAADVGVPATLLYSSRTLEDVIYREELDRLAAADPALGVVYTLTRAQPDGWNGYARRIDGEMLAEVFGEGAEADAFVCGPTRFVEVAADGLVGLGYDPGRVRTERFGPSGP
ncbi:MAG TPA: ferredoxin reductase [Gaiellaceae bacterium]|nr:ferredoxin reductase [Gaiellaceae bacterium]